MRARSRRGTVAGLTLALALAAAPGDPAGAAGGQPRRALTARDLVELRDIGPNSPIGALKLFSISPDQRWLAVQVRQADPNRNDYRLAMMGIPLARSGPVTMVDRGGEMILLSVDLLGKAKFKLGIARPITPRWSPTSQWFAYLKQLNGRTQLWRAFVDGRPSEQLTHESIDIDDFALTTDGAGVIIQTRPGLAAAMAAIDRERATGFRMDQRFMPTIGSTPIPVSAGEPLTEVLRLSGGGRRVATAAERARITAGVPTVEVGSDGGMLQVTRTSARSRLGDEEITATTAMASAPPPICPASLCRGRLSGPWRAADGRSLFFVRREGWAEGETALYQWTPGNGAPRLIRRSNDLLDDCEAWQTGLICIEQGSTTPRHVVHIDAGRGETTTLYDPNPGLAGLALGAVSREQWRTSRGTPVFGDLVLPTDYAAGKRYPLVVVQYESHGFLRGGTGDEYPIQLFANHGYVVLSLQKPTMIGIDRARDYIDLDRIGLEHFANRDDVLSAIETEVRRLTERGLVDPARVAITGLSEGTSSVQYAAINSRLFAAGIASGCCWEPEQDALLGEAARTMYHQVGWPKIIDRADALWRRVSLVRSGSRFPLLIETPDNEYLMGLTAFTALRERGTPVEMFVYPDEFHVKFQPSHRLAVYERNLAWLDYWLKDIPPGEPAWREQLAAWDAYKRARRDNPNAFIAADAPTASSAPPSSLPRAAAAGGHDGAVDPDRSVAAPLPPPRGR